MEIGFDYTDDLIMQTSILNAAGGDTNAETSWGSLGNASVSLSPTNASGQPSVTIAEGQDDEEILEDGLETELFHGYPAPLLTIATAFCLLFMMVGIPGNLITIIALFRCKKVRNATAVFIINLSVSDLMSCCFNLPLAASTFWRRSWRHGLLLCRLFPLLRYGLLAVSLFTVLAITINRYVMIGHPTIYPKLYRKQYLGLMVAATWICGFGALIATWLGRWGKFGLDPKIGSCSILPDSSGRSPKEFLFLVAFVIPCICIVVCYARIFYIVRKTALKSRVAGRSAASVTSGGTTLTRSGYYGKVKLVRKGNTSSTDDSAFATSSTAQSFSTEKSSTILDNGEMGGNETVIKMVNLAPSPHLLAPQRRSKICAEASSSSGIEEGLREDDEVVSTRSDSPISACSSSPPPAHYSVKVQKIKKRSERVNSTLSHMASVFRRTSHARGVLSPSRRQSCAPPQPGKMTAKDKKLLKMILVIFASFVTCYLPITLSKTYRDLVEMRALNIAGYILIYLTTCINPIIYVVMSSEYRQAYKNLLMCRSADSQVNTASKP
ncbi:G-protein coupled receptor moody isoform X1 [Rhodnius prolixus]